MTETLTKEQIRELSDELLSISLFPSNLDLTIKKVEDRFTQIGAILNLLQTESEGIEDIRKTLDEDLFNTTNTLDTLAQRIALMIGALVQATAITQ